ncbi:Cysteine-rich CPCC [Nocardiopsis flavescens]|uniref:Cysteine-rich CPCC n=1 Tax=Nocardiopsis flavescens TaxID=758803 RepID=A0A1M6JJ80_9ACTN|nr:CPCC family cysteine-rich protein [Nocardiopsis flavescens]SHJ46675.1 Cysteine-rich CPCC [Nocardiopsis flavescens]
MSGAGRWPCPCCGYLVLEDGPGMYEICPICFWEDDRAQLRWPLMAGGANRVRLVDAQRHYADHGVCREEDRPHVRPATDADRREPGFRHIDLLIDDIELAPDPRVPWPADLAGLYWWRPGFGRRRGEGLSPAG